MPFILRGVTLVGIDSVYCTSQTRNEAWKRLVTDLDVDHLEKMTKTINISQVAHEAENMFKNKTYGRIVIDINAEYSNELLYL